MCSINPTLSILAPFPYVLQLFAILKSYPSFFASNCMFHVIFHLIMNPISLSHHYFHLIMNLISFSFLQVLPPYSGKRSTNRVLIWYRILIKETRGHIRASGFKLIIRLLPERSANVTLVHTLAERWWDTTHTFHIGDREMTIAPHDFHMTDLRIDGAWINLEGE